MIIGLTGAHRTGKTTLAKAYAEAHGLSFMETPVSAIFAELGFHPGVPMTFKERMDVQEVVLERLEAIYKTATVTGAITDRTPLDMIAYTMADAIGDTVPEDQQQRFANYVQKCLDVTNKYFSTLVLIQPGVGLVPAEGKAALNLAYIEHLSMLILGFLGDGRLKVRGFSMRRSNLSMESRLEALTLMHRAVTETAENELAAHLAADGLIN